MRDGMISDFSLSSMRDMSNFRGVYSFFISYILPLGKIEGECVCVQVFVFF